MSDDIFSTSRASQRSLFTEGGMSSLSRLMPKRVARSSVNNSELAKHVGITPQQFAGVLLRVFGSFYTYSTILHLQLPPLVHAFYIHAFSTGAYLISSRSSLQWSNALRKQMLLVCVHAGWQVLSFVLWLTALLMLHPIQAVLAEYSEHLFLALLTEHLNRSAGSSSLKRRGVVFRFLASLALLGIAHGWYEIPAGQPEHQKFHPQSNTYGGLALMVIYSLSEVLRKSYKGWLSRSVDMQSVTVLSNVLSVPMLLPFVVLYSSFAPHAWSTFQSIPHLLTLLINSVVVVVLPAYFLSYQSSGSESQSPAAVTGSTVSPLTPSRVQFCFTMLFAFLLHFFIIYNPESTPLGFGYTISLLASSGCMFAALTASHHMITRGSQPYVVDPYAEYELPDVEDIERGLLSTLLKSHTSKKLLAFLLLNVFYMSIEFLYGAFSGSLGLISDSFHMMLDSVSVAIALVASYVATWPENSEHAFGYGRYEVLSGFSNGIILICIAAYIFMESIVRIAYPRDIQGDYLLSVSVGGLCINVIGVVFFHEAHHIGGGSCSHSHSPSHESCSHSHSHGHSHSELPLTSHNHSHGGSSLPSSSSANMRGVYLHILADLFGSIGVIISSCIVSWTGFTLADPICSVLISGLIFASAIPLLQDTGKILMLSLTASQSAEVKRCTSLTEEMPEVSKTYSTFWQHTPGTPAGMVYVSANTDADEIELLNSVKQIYAAVAKPAMVTVEITKKSF